MISYQIHHISIVEVNHKRKCIWSSRIYQSIGKQSIISMP
jgi:hypothetical protein